MVTPSVAAQGDTNPSDAAAVTFTWQRCLAVAYVGSLSHGLAVCPRNNQQNMLVVSNGCAGAGLNKLPSSNDNNWPSISGDFLVVTLLNNNRRFHLHGALYTAFHYQ